MKEQTLAATSKTTLPLAKIGTVLIWVGVLAWVPFLTLRTIGYKPSLFIFLPFHLVGVVGGARLRKMASKAAGITQGQRPWHRKLGHMLIILGVLTWVPYFYLKFTAPTPPMVGDFLPIHLTGVLSGITITILGKVYEMRMAKAEQE